MAAEDARFFRHDGVDALALGRAAWQLARTGRVVSGGSTITMQLARLRFGLPRTAFGKLAELALARRIEAGTPKPAILEAYVNRLPMGGDLVGVEAGARTYFGLPARELDLAQAALLAALPNDPVRLDPYAHRAALEARRRAVLARMVATGAIGADDAARAAAERVAVLPRGDGIAAAPHLLFRLAANVPPSVTRVRTTIDRDLQRFAENETAHVVAALSERGVRDGAALVLDNRDGAVLAYVGSADYFARTGAGKNDGVAALRQPGSALKPFLYELAFERRVVRPTTILADVPATYAIPGARTYRPSDYSQRFAGPVRARIALADSLNVPAVRVLSEVGVPAFLDRLRALGFAHLTRGADEYGLGLALGDGEVTLEELAGAYAAAANGGRRVRVHAVMGGAADGAGGVADDTHDAGASATTAVVGMASEWGLVTDVLADAHARARAFGVASQLSTSFASAVKTGTSSDFRDTWTVGYTRDYTVATWVGKLRRDADAAGERGHGRGAAVEPDRAPSRGARRAGAVRAAARVRAAGDVRDDRSAADARLRERRGRVARPGRSGGVECAGQAARARVRRVAGGAAGARGRGAANRRPARRRPVRGGARRAGRGGGARCGAAGVGVERARAGSARRALDAAAAARALVAARPRRRAQRHGDLHGS